MLSFIIPGSLLLLLAASSLGNEDQDALTLRRMKSELNREFIDADRIVRCVRSIFADADLRKGACKTDGMTVLWALESDDEVNSAVVGRMGDAPDRVENGKIIERGHTIWNGKPVTKKSLRRWPMRRIGTSPLRVVAIDIPNFSAFPYHFETGEKRLEGDWVGSDVYPVDADSLIRPIVPKGRLIEREAKSRILDGASHRYQIYVPAQYQPDGPPACAMVFNDGDMYLNPPASVPTVFDNLIHKGEMPVTIGVFINPGWISEDGKEPVSRRIAEYHERSDRYARFLRDEIFPDVETIARLREDAASHAICGISSGAVCAFTAAWEMPDLFGKVVSHVGSFTNILGSYVYWTEIRETPAKPIRIFMQDGANDIDDICGNWYLANQEMAAALRFAGYEMKFVVGKGFHNLSHGGAIFPETMRWLWRVEN